MVSGSDGSHVIDRLSNKIGLTRAQLKVWLVNALGQPNVDEIRAEIGEGSSTDGTIRKWLSPGELGPTVYELYPSTLVQERLSFLGLDRLAAELGINTATVLDESADYPSREGIMLRLLLATAEVVREPAFAVRREAITQSYLRNAFDLDADILAGDGTIEIFDGLAGLPALQVEPMRPGVWRPFQEHGGAGVATLADVAAAIGWERMADGLDAGRAVWNGRLVRLARAQIENPDDRARTLLRLTLQETDYVSQTATSFTFRDWGTKATWLLDKANRLELCDRLIRLREALLLSKNCQGPNDPYLPPVTLLDALATREWTPAQRAAIIEQRRQELAREVSADADLRDSVFANALSVNITYITSDGYLLVQRRAGKNVGHGWVDWQTGAAGFVALPRDETIPGTDLRPSPWNTAVNETREEMGRGDIKTDAIRLLAIVRERRNFEVGVLGYGYLPDPLQRVQSRLADKHPTVTYDPRRHALIGSNQQIIRPGLDQGHEVLGFAAVLFEPQTVFDFVLRYATRPPTRPDKHDRDAFLSRLDLPDGRAVLPWDNGMPLGMLSWLFALVKVRYGGNWGRLERDWQEAKERFLRSVG